MMHEFTNAGLFVLAILKVALMTGIGPGIAIALLLERFHVVGVGFETVSGDGQLAREERLAGITRDENRPLDSWATSPSAEVCI